MNEPKDQEMSKRPSERERIDESAQDWFFTLTSDRVTEADRARFAAWRDADPRHRAAYDELRHLWEGIDDLRDAFAPQSARTGHAPKRPRKPTEIPWPGPTTRQQAPAPLGRRQALWGSVAAACLTLIVIAAPEVTTWLASDHVTGVGEQARVTLPDSSVAWLNTDTAIAVDFDGDHRRIALLRGEAQFDVAKDPARPFSVLAHRGRTTALGTVISVRERGAQETTVTVSEGQVEVVSPVGAEGAVPADPAARALLTAGEQVTYREGAAPGSVRAAPAKALAWRNGVIAIDGLPLTRALAEIDRYRPGRILLLADAARLEPVTARLSLDALDNGLEALAATQGLQVTRVTNYLVLIR